MPYFIGLKFNEIAIIRVSNVKIGFFVDLGGFAMIRWGIKSLNLFNPDS